jgi:hypothetical protein
MEKIPEKLEEMKMEIRRKYTRCEKRTKKSRVKNLRIEKRNWRTRKTTCRRE